jgi:UDP-glucuronate 4-epimerase
MKILVTGCCGFIGSHLCEFLLKNTENTLLGVDIMNNYYDIKQKEENLDILSEYDNFDFYRENICETKIISNQKPELIIHLAAMAGVRYSIENPKLYIDTNIKGTIHLLEECQKNNINKFIYASSSSVYGKNFKIPFSEKDPIENMNSPYAVSKRCSELYAKLYHELYKINCIGLRFFTVYGPRGRPDMAPYIFLKKIMNSEIISVFGNGTSMRDYTYVSDIVNGINGAINLICKNKKKIFKIYNLGNNKPVELNKFIEICEQVSNKKANLKYIEERKGDVPITYADINSAKKEIGFNPKINLKNGLLLTLEWLYK